MLRACLLAVLCTGSGVVRMGPLCFLPGGHRRLCTDPRLGLLSVMTGFFCFSFVFLVYVLFCFIAFGCQYQYNQLTHLWNDLLCVVKWDVKPYTLTHVIHLIVGEMKSTEVRHKETAWRIVYMRPTDVVDWHVQWLHSALLSMQYCKCCVCSSWMKDHIASLLYTRACLCNIVTISGLMFFIFASFTNMTFRYSCPVHCDIVFHPVYYHIIWICWQCH